MPKSKRQRVVRLTKTVSKKDRAAKEKIIQEIRDNIDLFSHIYVFTYENIRNDKLKEIREDWKSSKFYFGRNRLLSIALGRTADEEYKENLHHLTQHIKGDCGVLFTSCSSDEVSKYFSQHISSIFPRAGFQATHDYILPAGDVPNVEASMENQLRSLDLPVKRVRGVLVLEQDHAICRDGDILTPEQCRLLKLFEVEMATFQIRLQCVWSDSQVTML